MNREIKFRGFVLETEDSVLRPNVWEYGDLMHNQRGLPSETIYRCSIWNGLLYYVDPQSVGQFTGLYDSEGKEIYEGDVLKYDDRIFEVFYKKAAFYLKEKELSFPFYIKNMDNLTIIGNIYENPDIIT